MNVLGLFKGNKDANAIDQEALTEIEKHIPVTTTPIGIHDPVSDDDSVCSGGCHSDDEDVKRGEEIFQKLKIDKETPLLNTSKTPKIHFIVPTSQIDWQFDACNEKEDSVQYKINKWCNDHMDEYSNVGEGQTLTCSVTSLPKNIMDIEVMKGTKNNVLVLPFFVWIKDLRSENVNDVLDDLVPKLLKHDIDRDQLLREREYLSLAREKAFVFICSHTTRDKRCGVTAPYLCKTFEKLLRPHGLYRDNSDFRPDGVNIAFINHVGGHKYAGNVQIYLKREHTLIWLGRITPKNVGTIIENVLVPDVATLPLPDKVRCIRKYEAW
ncbi:Apd1p NDAI_0A06980 [Naumovozyma dairenensis CBS 421]|uniref:Actin patches distal protein 1 n=1 Tax=Naumovozyma dairenensis (strain ATCC 10597 / BCRC 20456 / CBS 421 / NBRC 0211 / NRRL Y-12639) TaxID=1071378 RepID=G0W4W4_NAUDC|nr:hypothetical protein NDAI_0A06980 [Naumovozyma dairenensis CBS 421]CCD22852.1 hypothetical protein NDAI_0A06980 [Naumovozyma dairenensis CBS 421]